MKFEKAFPAVIDSTMLASYSACQRQFELGTLYSLRPSGTSIHLHAGGAYAEGMEKSRKAFYEDGVDELTAKEIGIAALTERYGEYDSGKETKSLDRMVGAMEFYFDNYPMATDAAQVAKLGSRHAIEFSFAIPLPINHPETGEPLLFSGRCDAIVNFAGGLYALDDKTTSSLGPKWAEQWAMRSQFTGYAWAMKQLGMKPAGTLIRGVSILKTKYETAQSIVSQPEWKMERWYESSLKKIRRMIEIYQTGDVTYDLSEACNGYGACPYKQVCLNADPAQMLEIYYDRIVWNPLTHTAEKK